jgi:hypothetical protein
MLNEIEKGFVDYWEKNRVKKKRVINQLAVGLPLATGFVILIFVNLVSGWFKGAAALIHENSSLVLVILIALILIVIFIVVFAARHNWDQNEQRYRELLARQDLP